MFASMSETAFFVPNFLSCHCKCNESMLFVTVLFSYKIIVFWFKWLF